MNELEDDTAQNSHINGLMYNADWTHGLDSRTGLSNFAGNDFKAIIQKFSNSCNTRDTIIAL